MKKGDPAALALLGYTATDLAVSGPRVLTPEVTFPGALRFTAFVRNGSAEPAPAAIDYVIHHRRANGTV